MRKGNVRKTAWAVLAVVAAGLIVGAVVTRAEEAKPETIVIDGSTTVGPIAKAFAEYYMKEHQNVKITVSESGSGNGAKSLINSTCQIATMSRFMKETEFKAAIEKSVFPVAHVIAMDGIAVIVHPANPLKALTTRQIKDIYTGKVKKWSELGGPDVEIVKISRDTNSGTYETFEEKVLKGEKMTDSTEYVGSSGAIRQRIQSTPAAIGYVGIGFIDSSVNALEVNNVACTKKNVVAGKYPISRPLFMFTNGYPDLGGAAHAFVTLHLTKKGQEMIESTGFVPLTQY